MAEVTEENIDDVMKGMLQKKVWIIMTRDIAPKEVIRKTRVAHIRHQIDLEKRGILLAAGGLRAPDGTRIQGQIIIRADSEEEARKIADSDPHHKACARDYMLYQWSMNEGGFNVHVRFSDRSYTLD